MSHSLTYTSRAPTVKTSTLYPNYQIIVRHIIHGTQIPHTFPARQPRLESFEKAGASIKATLKRSALAIFTEGESGASARVVCIARDANSIYVRALEAVGKSTPGSFLFVAWILLYVDVRVVIETPPRMYMSLACIMEVQVGYRSSCRRKDMCLLVRRR